MPALPREIPRFTKDLRQRWDDLGCPPLPPATDRHDALVDARHNLLRWNAMTGKPMKGAGAARTGWRGGRDRAPMIRLLD